MKSSTPRTSKLFVEGITIPWEPAGAGVRRKILGYGPNLMMVAVEFEAGSIGPLHKHPHTQVTYIETGSFEVRIGAEKKILSGGDCYFVPPNVEHGVVALARSSLVDVFTPVREDFLTAKQ